MSEDRRLWVCIEVGSYRQLDERSAKAVDLF